MTGRTLKGFKWRLLLENREGIVVGGWRKWNWQKRETSIYVVRSMIKRILKKLVDLAIEISRWNVQSENLLLYSTLIKIGGIISIKKEILVFKQT